MKERGFGFREENLLSPADALAAFFAAVLFEPPQREFVELDDALGRILGAHIDADRDYPDAARSAMDGFALAAASVPGRLAVAGEIAMGSAWNGALAPDTALRIPTGGVLPDGADAVVPIEDAVFDPVARLLQIAAAIEPGENVNPAAGDVRAHETVLLRGTRIGGSHLGVLAMLGITSVPVFRRPQIAVISSGDELIAPGLTPGPGQIRDSNRYAVAGSLRAMGAAVRHVPTVRDEPGALESALRTTLECCDAAVITGGSSVGERDCTPAAIDAVGTPGVLVHGLRVKPGKPTVLAAIGHKPVIGLPGNPTSALMILEAVVAPIIFALTGELPAPRAITAVLDAPARSHPGWTWFVPVSLRHEGPTLAAHPLVLRSSTVSLSARADGYLTMGEDEAEIQAGTQVCISRFA